jgi:hypothetical protein
MPRFDLLTVISKANQEAVATAQYLIERALSADMKDDKESHRHRWLQQTEEFAKGSDASG